VDDLETLVAGVTAAEPGNLDSWLRLKRDAKQKLDQTHFSLLGLPANGAGVSSADVKKAYRTQCILWHPDKHVQSEEAKHRAHGMFQRVNEANEVLSDPLKKQQYEYKLRFSSPRTTASSSGFAGFGGTTTSSPSPYGRGAAGRGGYGQRSSPTGCESKALTHTKHAAEVFAAAGVCVKKKLFVFLTVFFIVQPGL